MKKALFFGALLIWGLKPAAQQFGGNPAYIHWRQINTGSAKIIYPEGLDSIAQRIANVTAYMQQHYSSTIGGKLRKVSIVVQANTSVTNGYVALAPFRSEFYLMPPQAPFSLGAQNWADNLSIHEFRHVQQYSNFNRGWSKVAAVLFGQQGQDVANAAAIPNWFFEGDAVYNETMLSHQGRGRLPAFLAGFRGIYNDGRQYNYMQLRNGSLQHLVPDWYPLGYMLVAYGREKYGDDFWLKVTQDAAAFKPLVYPFQHAVKKYAGVPFNQFVSDAFTFYQTNWQQDSAKPLNWLTPVEKNNVINYRYPYLLEDGSLLALKYSTMQIPAFVKIQPGQKEQEIAVRDISYDDYFSYNNGKIVYSAIKADSRWGYKDYSIIKILDASTGTTQTISHKTKYFSPDISHNGQVVAAVKMEGGLQSSMVLLDTSGNILKEWKGGNGTVFSFPKFSVDDQYLYQMVRNNSGMMGIEKRNLADGSVTTVLGLSNRVLGYPVVQGDTLLYTSSAGGYDEIWAFVQSAQKQYRIARYATGLYQAVFNRQHQLVASAFTAGGYRLAAINPVWQPTASPADTLVNQYVTAPFKSVDNNTLANVGHQTYPSQKYAKASHLVNFHSYRPFYDYPNSSLAIYGDNVLQTMQAQVYYNHNNNEGYNQVGVSGVYGGTYLQPVFGVNQTYNRSFALNKDTTLHWREFNVAAGLRLPLNFSQDKLYQYLTLSSTYNYKYQSWQGIAKNFLLNQGIQYLETKVDYSWQVQQAVKQIYPSWAQVIVLQHRVAVNAIQAQQFLASGAFYLPGLVKTNSFVITAAYQARDTAGQYNYTNDFPMARGYSNVNYPRMWKLGGNYHFPLAYPDRGFGNIIFIQRIRANLFFDYAAAKSLRYQTTRNFTSTGAELYFDTKLWNQLPATFGFRYSQLLNGGGSFFEIMLPSLIIN